MITFGLLRKSDEEIIRRWGALPSRIDLPNGDVVMGAEAGWSNEEYETIQFEEPDSESAAPARYLVPKVSIVDRLIAAGLLSAARSALDSQDLATVEKWNARAAIYNDDPTTIALLQAIGANPAVIMAEDGC